MWDGLVIGGGLAGLCAGIRAQERGKKVLIVSEGTGSLAFASGALDFGKVEQLRQEEKHPYTFLGEIVEEAFRYFLELCPDYQGTWGRMRSVLTPLGTLRPTVLLPRRLDASSLEQADRIILMLPQGLKDFFPEVVRANLQKQFSSSKIELKKLHLNEFADWYSAGKPIPGTVYAKFWGTDRGREILRNYIREIVQNRVSEHEAVIFPGLPVTNCPEVEDVLNLAPMPVVGMISFPPSAAGQALYEQLKARFRVLGGELLIGSGVGRVEIEAGRVRRVMVQSKGKEISFPAKAFVLATGGFLSRGISATPNEVRETVFGLPLYLPSRWSEARFLGEQPYAYTGIEVDQSLHPCVPGAKEALLDNVFVVGRMLAHWDPWLEKCGGGVSLASGFLAGELL